MKHGRRPTKRQKIAMKAVGLNFENWLVYKVTDGQYHLVHRYTGTTRKIPV
ncbi:DUF6906 family protein [Bacillus sp. T33-2]|uniref:DUF6906 family protein n=1 Tax=Bacillus sp. T33-2 TaxID=2054168 RepID=UPI0015E10ACD|nr:hypothetical protein [Bacillus sp. T33-2]